ncbi:hypothetical protein M422DRAFT_191457, partial [Sphaerobolus stellatus SS14]
LSEVTNELSAWLDEKWCHLLDWDEKVLLHPSKQEEYADAFRTFDVPAASVCDLIDCTIKQTCRMTWFQEPAYTGYKKYHGIKFQGITIPNGLIGHLAGPFQAPQNDNGVYTESGIYEKMINVKTMSLQWLLYGDSAYGLSPVILSPYASVSDPTPEELPWNKAIGKMRISVEHGFGLVIMDWPFLDCFWKQKIWGIHCYELIQTLASEA